MSQNMLRWSEMFENMKLVILFDMLLSPSFKMTTSFANISRTTASTSKSMYDAFQSYYDLFQVN